MKSFALTEQAEPDANEIWEYIAENNLDIADRIRDELHGAMQNLAAMPEMGHLRPDLADARYRFWVVRSYLIVYLPEIEPLQIIRVLHTSRDIQRLF